MSGLYTEEEYLMISGLQHFAFCRRQWALIHIEQLWNENLRTVEGEILHEKAHDPLFTEKRKGVLTVRSLAVHSAELGITGKCDVVEFYEDLEGIDLHGRTGLWRPVPVEYKRGHSKETDADRLQLCAQAMCLEEMLCCEIPFGYLYYGETRIREEVPLLQELRQKVLDMLKEMHQYNKRQYTPKVKPTKACNACSLRDLCLPKLYRKESVQSYLKAHLSEDGI